MKKPSIPAVAPGLTNAYNVLVAIKGVVDTLTGARGSEIQRLSTTATSAEIISKINEIVARLNASGE